MRARRRSDQQLLDATREGEIDAFGLLFERHAETVLAFLRRRIAGAEAADLTAETFAAALDATMAGRAGSVPNAAAWLIGIARFKLIDSYRSARVEDQARRRLAIEPLEIEDAELARIDELAGPGLPAQAALAQLSVEEREAIIARILHERDYEEIARELDQTQTTIRKRVSRGLTRMRKQMGVQVG